MTPEESFLEGVAAQRVAHLIERGNLGEFLTPVSRQSHRLIVRAAEKARRQFSLPAPSHVPVDETAFNHGVAAQKVASLLQNGNVGEFEVPMSKLAHAFISDMAEKLRLRVTVISFNRFRIQ